MYAARKEVIENFLPERSVAIVSGSSGAGKTRLVMQSVDEWYSKATFLDFNAKPDPQISYYTYDRTEEDVKDTLADMKLYFPKMAIHCGFTGIASNYPSRSIFQKSDCVIIDGIDFLVGNANDSEHVRNGFRTLYDLMAGTPCATIGITGSNKAKVGEGYANSRDRMIGSSAWARLSGTGINIVYDEDALINSRIIHITPRRGDKIRLEMDFNKDGRLVRAAASTEDDTMTRLYKFMPDVVSTGEAVDIGGHGLKLSEATVKRYLNALLSDGRIAKIEHGRYRKTLIN